MANTSNYCALPFRGMQIWTDGSLKPCCMYNQDLHVGKIYNINAYNEWWSNGLTTLRNNFIEQKLPASCSLCFNKTFQNSGVRVNVNKWLANNQLDYNVSNTPEHIDITFGNVCNLKCIMCSSFSSSKIEAEYQQHKQKYNSIGIIQPAMPKLNKWWEDSKILEQVLHIISKAKYINFSGGEPLLTPQIVDMLKVTPKNCQVEINTNLTKLTDEHIDCLRKFDLARISISLDGVGPHHEYVRYDSNWSEIENNINKLFGANLKNLEIAFSYILQHTSIYTFPSFWNYMKDFTNRIRISEVVPNTHKDNLMTINSAHPTDVSKFQQWLIHNPNKYSNILETWIDNYKFDLQSHNEFKQYMSTIDQIRGCDFVKTFNPSW